MKTQTIFAVAALLVIFSCHIHQEQRSLSFAPDVVEARGYVVPKDSMASPKKVPVGKPRVVRAGKPKVVLTYTHVQPAGNSKEVTAGVPKVHTPGQGGFSLPKIVPAIDSPFSAGIPEVVMAKEAHTKEQNPQNFSSFGKLQGLKSNDIMCMLEDKRGNLWIGTNGEGVSKYDGKTFTHYTQKEGLNNNFVYSILEDKRGNLWFGSIGGGVSKYDGKSFTNFTKKEGLSNNWVWTICEDIRGDLWLGTGEGLSRYDGKTFTHFTKKQGLINNQVNSILKDKHGSLWFGTSGGVSRYDGKSFTCLTEKEGLSSNAVTSILEDKSGKIWIGTESGGVDRYDGKSFKHFTVKDGLSEDYISSITKDKHGNLWFGTFSKGVIKFDGKSFTYFTDKEGLSDNDVKCLLKDKRGNLWVGTDGGGVNKYRGEIFTHFTKKEGLSGNRVFSMLEDKRGNLWFGTWEGGVSKYDGKSFTHFTQKEGQYKVAVQKMLEDRKGNLWFGDWNGLSKYDGKTFTYFTDKEGLSHISIISMLEDKSGNLWFGTVDGGIDKYDGKSFTHFTKKEGLSNNCVTSILEDRKGEIWIGTYGGGINKYDGKGFTHFTKKEGLKDNNIKSLLEDKNGNLWVGTWDGGVSKFDGKRFTHFTQTEGLASNDVRSMLQDKTGNLWFGTAGGLSKLEKAKLASFTNVTTDKSASWLSESGLLFKTYTYDDGFLGIDVNWEKTICEAKDGTLWIGAGDRLTAFHPGEETHDTIAPNIQLTGLTLYNENIPWQYLLSPQSKGSQRSGVKDTTIVLGNGVRAHHLRFSSVSRWYGLPQQPSLPYNNNYLTFQFVGITLQSPKKVKYQYKLEGLDENWSALTNRTEAAYGNLPYGKYTFKVKAMNGEGYWSKEFNYSFILRAPWWRTWWAYLIYAFSSVVFISVVIWYRSRRLRIENLFLEAKVVERTKELEESLEERYKLNKKIESQQALLNERLRISRELHDDMGSTLGSISIYSEVAKNRTEKNENANEVLSKIGLASRELIDKMSDIVWSLNPNNLNFGQLQNRMTAFAAMIMAPRNILYDFIADEKLKNTQFTAEQLKSIFLIFKEALYNVVKYADCKTVRINFFLQNNDFIMLIKDDGKGFDVSGVTNEITCANKYLGGNGIRNMNARADDINAKLWINSNVHEGTRVQLMLSL